MVLITQSVIERQVFGQLEVVLHEGRVMLGHSEGAAQLVRGNGAVVRVTQEKGGQRSSSAGTEQGTHHRSVKGVTTFQIVIKHGVVKGVKTPVIGAKLDGVFPSGPRQCFQDLLGALVGVLILKSDAA